ncbi:hypothetical protein SprV_0100457100 [Sparganum proliferum]
MLAETADSIFEYYQPPVTVNVASRSKIAPTIEDIIKRLDALTLEDGINSQSSPVVFGRQLNLSALDNCNDFMLEFGTLLSILGNLFDGNISDIPSEECRRLDSLVHLIANESSDRQKRSYNFLLKNVPRSALPIDVATNFLYSCGFNYKIADAKRLSSRSKNPPILVKLFSSIEVDTIFAHRDRATAYLENAKLFLCHDLTPMERRIGSLFSRKPTASQSNANQLGHNTSGREVSACPTPTTSDSLLPLTPTSPSHSNHLTNLSAPKLAAAAPVVVSYPPDSPTGTHENPSTSARPITPLDQLGAASSTVKSPVAWRQNGETPELNQTPTQQKGSKIPHRGFQPLKANCSQTKKLRRQLRDPSTSSLSVHLRITEIFEMASRMCQARDRQRESIALSGSNPGKSVANIFRHRSSSKRGHELPPLLNDNKVFLTDDTDKAELFSAFFAKHLATESDPVPFVRSLSDMTLSTIDVSSDLIKKHISRLKNSHCSGTDGIPNSIIK